MIRNTIGTLVALAIAWLAITAFIGYSRVGYQLGNLESPPPIIILMARNLTMQQEPAWETASPTFWLAFDFAASQHSGATSGYSAQHSAEQTDTSVRSPSSEQTAERTDTPLPSPSPWLANGEKPCVPSQWKRSSTPKVVQTVVGTITGFSFGNHSGGLIMQVDGKEHVYWLKYLQVTINECPMMRVDRNSVITLGKTVVRVTLDSDSAVVNVTAPGRAYLSTQ